MRNMRQFFEKWTRQQTRQTLAGKLSGKRETHALEICQPVADDLGPNDAAAFMSIGFTHHMAMISACRTVEEPDVA